ncbi:MAG: ABC-2 family transporter protein [Thermomicrobiales bacterium]|nr:ABC-2 family transporter protein [Thermomicrobiales bacterium]
MHAFTVVRTYLRLGLLNFVQYRADFFLGVVNAAVQFATQLLAITIVFNQTESLGGWSRQDLIVLVGVHAIVSGILGMIFSPSIGSFLESIRLGTFDFLLTKPVDAQLLASVQSVAPQSTALIAAGLAIIGYGLHAGAGFPGIGAVLMFILLLLAGLCMVYSFMLVLASMAFWFVKLDNIMNIFSVMFGNAGTWPITIFPAWLRGMLTFIIPIAFAVTIPAQALTGALTVGNVALTFALAAVFLTISRFFWRFAIRQYTGASA